VHDADGRQDAARDDPHCAARDNRDHTAFNSLSTPRPQLDWNPKLKDGQGTFVNLQTWCWLDNPVRTLAGQASVPGQEATVTATFKGMGISAPGEDDVSCPDTGTPYAPGARATCSMAFSQASSRLGTQTTPVKVTSRWFATWTYNGADRGAIDTQPAPRTTTTDNQVNEVQTLVTGAR